VLKVLDIKKRLGSKDEAAPSTRSIDG
jgi:hypothetical protein